MQAVLESPMGVVRLMDMLGDKDALRNEALLLFMGLSRSNATIQQIAAFEGAFERLLNIIKYVPFHLLSSNTEMRCRAALPATRHFASLHVRIKPRKQVCICQHQNLSACFTDTDNDLSLCA